MRKIIYVAHYAKPNNFHKRTVVLAAVNKIDYICHVIRKLGYDIDMLSPVSSAENKIIYPEIQKLKNGIQLKHYISFPWTSFLSKVLCVISSKIGLFIDLLKIDKNTPVIVYHSLFYMWIIKIAHRIKRFPLIIEVEEIYADVTNKTNIRKQEMRFFHEADAYIFPTIKLNDLINLNNKPFVIVHGTYMCNCEDKNCKNLKTDKNDEVHCVYSGTLRKKKGVFNAINVASYLPDNYIIHILGFGSEEEINDVEQKISEVSYNSKCKITYDGVLTGDEFSSFLKKCSIGLCTQSQNNKYNDTSFPSKILTYLVNDLSVVSSRIPVVESSNVHDYVVYYDNDNPRYLAEAIMSINTKQRKDNKNIIDKLDFEFTKDMNVLLKNIKHVSKN